jgi:hypothetical protein
VQGVVVGGTTTLVRGGNALVRLLQGGLVRYYVLLVAVGLGGLTLYFLLQS